MGPWRVCIAVALTVAWVAQARQARVELSERADSIYARHKAELFLRYVDEYGLVVARSEYEAAGIGDAVWRTGLAAMCFAIEKDHESTARLLYALSTSGWRDGWPVRHPLYRGTVRSHFSRDQFVPQMAACYYGWKYGNDEVRALSVELLSRFVEVLRRNDWCLAPGGNARLTPNVRFALKCVADRMGVAFPGDASGNAFVTYLYLKSLELRARGDDPPEFYGVHLLFIQALLVSDARPVTHGLRPAIQSLYRACRRHRMAPMYWLAGHSRQPRHWLEHWPRQWERIDYAWQRSRSTQNRIARTGWPTSSPRIDYMVLRRLFDLDAYVSGSYANY